MFKQLKEGTNVSQENKKQMNKIKKSIYDMKMKFSKEIEIVKKTQTKVVMEMQNTIDFSDEQF